MTNLYWWLFVLCCINIVFNISFLIFMFRKQRQQRIIEDSIQRSLIGVMQLQDLVIEELTTLREKD